MALVIKEATHGAQSSGVSTLESNIHSNCIIKAKNQLDTNFNNLTTAVDDIWVGKSAENFKSNMRKDVDAVQAGLESCYRVLEYEISAIDAVIHEDEAHIVEEY